MTYSEAMSYIESVSKRGIVLGLDTTRELLKRLGNPQDKLKFVHIAGTNGKGSTLAVISEILTTAGYRTGRYISPAIHSYNEKIQINGEFISNAAIACIVDVVKQACDMMVEDGFEHPTVFEIETAVAFIYFLNEQCDIVVLETGMGGMYDSTNVINTTLCAVLTSISLDHVGMIGNNISEITRCKAGIIKPGCQVVLYSQDKCVEDIVKNVAWDLGVKVNVNKTDEIYVKEDSIYGQCFDYYEFKSITTSLLGEHQRYNISVAIEVCKVLRTFDYNISDEDIISGIANARWQGRFDVISNRPLIIADGAHNPDGAKTFVKSVEKYLDGYVKIFVMGVLKDKDYNTIIELTKPYADAIITINPDNARALSDVELKDAVMANGDSKIPVIAAGRIESGIEMATQIAMQLNNERTAIVVFGSLSFLGDLYRYVL